MSPLWKGFSTFSARLSFSSSLTTAGTLDPSLEGFSTVSPRLKYFWMLCTRHYFQNTKPETSRPWLPRFSGPGLDSWGLRFSTRNVVPAKFPTSWGLRTAFLLFGGSNLSSTSTFRKLFYVTFKTQSRERRRTWGRRRTRQCLYLINTKRGTALKPAASLEKGELLDNHFTLLSKIVLRFFETQSRERRRTWGLRPPKKIGNSLEKGELIEKLFLRLYLLTFTYVTFEIQSRERRRPRGRLYEAWLLLR